MFTVLFWKKVWAWIKHYWYWPVIIVLLICTVLSGRTSRKKLFDLLSKQKENYEKEIKTIKEVTEKASQEKTSIAKDYAKEVKKIEEEHDIKVNDLKEEKQKELEQTIKSNKDKPNKLAKEVAQITRPRRSFENAC